MKHLSSILLGIVICLNTSLSTLAQARQDKNWGVKIGIVANFGTHINQIGFKANAYGTYGFGQINLENTSTFSFSHLAERKAFLENRFALGGMLLGGPKNNSTDFMWGGLHHQTNYNNAVGYNYLWYTDNAGTSQKSGGWTLQFSDFQVFFENDIFAGYGRDKFRTGHLQFAYRYENYVFQTGVQLWTGETRGSTWVKSNLKNSPSGFRLLEDLPFGKTSHGIFYLGVNAGLPNENYVSTRLGIDSEQVRHIFQNRLSHDLIWLPKKIERHTPHYPRLNEEGCPVFFKEDIRRTQIFSQLGINNVWSY